MTEKKQQENGSKLSVKVFGIFVAIWISVNLAAIGFALNVGAEASTKAQDNEVNIAENTTEINNHDRILERFDKTLIRFENKLDKVLAK